MKIAVIGLGDSSKFYEGPKDFDLVIGCNRAAHFWELDYLVALDATTLRHFCNEEDPLFSNYSPIVGRPKLICKPDHWKRITDKYPKAPLLFSGIIQYPTIRDTFKRVANWTSCAALASAKWLGASELVCYGFDFNGSPDPDGTVAFTGQNRTDTRWANESRAFNKMLDGFRNKGILVSRPTAKGDIETTLARRRNVERAKYEKLWKQHGVWGTYNHGAQATRLVQSLNPNSLLDVGCGDNKFAEWARSQSIDATGVDFAGTKADIKASAHDLPFKDNAFDIVTAFDFLEHLLPEEVDEVLEELVRVGRSHLIFKIAYRKASTTGVDGEPLHMTIRRKRWWIDKLMRFGNTKEWKDYIHVELKNG